MNDFTQHEAQSLVGRRVELTQNFGEIAKGTEGLVTEAAPTPSGGWIVKVEWPEVSLTYGDGSRFHIWMNAPGFESFLVIKEADHGK